MQVSLWLQRGLLAVGLSLLLTGRSEGSLISYHTDVYVALKTPGVGSEIQLGDIFYMQLTLEDSATDFDPQLTRGEFDNFVKLDLVRNPANVGTWDPALDVWTLHSHVTTYSPAGLFDLQMLLDGAPSLSPLTINGNPAPASFTQFLASATVNDTGFGQTWAEQFLGFRFVFFALGISWAPEDEGRVVLQSSYLFTEGPHPQLSSAPVPEPASLVLFGLGLCGLGACSRRRRQPTT